MKKLVFFIVVFGLFLVVCATAYQSTPLPPDIKIIPPASDIPEEIAGFSGIWHGFSDSGNAITLIVEKINPPVAIVVYSWGKFKKQEGGWTRSEWKIEPYKLEKSRKAGATITYLLSDDGETLEGTYIYRDTQTRINYMTMERNIPEPLSIAINSTSFTPLPVVLKIIPPASDIPEEIAGFSGIWHGFWDNGRKTTLVVEKIELSTAIAIYSWGELKGDEGGWLRWEWTVEPGKLEIKNTEGVKIVYLLLPDGQLDGMWKKGWTKLKGIMQKQ